MASIFDKIKGIKDFQREEEEFQLRKQKLARDAQGDTPATLKVAGAIKEALERGDVDTANRIMQVHRSGAYGINTYGDAPLQPIQQPTQPTAQAPVQQKGIPGIFQAIQETINPAKAAPTPQAIAPQSYRASPTSGVAEVAARNAGLKSGEEANSRNASDFNYAAPIAKAKEIGASSGKVQSDINRKAATAPNNLMLIKEARTYLPNATSGLMGLGARGAANMFGKSTDASKADRQLSVIASALTAGVPRMEGPQSDKDTAMYKQAAGDVANPSVPYEDRLAALDVMEELQNKYSQAAGVALPEENVPTGNSIVPKAPKMGTVQDGYIFMGGNPADQKNWKKK